MTAEEWLANCACLFREDIDLSLQADIPRQQPYLEKLKDLVRKHAQFLDDAAAGLLSVKHVLSEVSRGDRSGGKDKKGGRRVNFDSEMVQEQRQEEEKEQQGC